VDSEWIEWTLPPVGLDADQTRELKRTLVAKGRDVAQDLDRLVAGLAPRSPDLLDVGHGETPIGKARRFLALIERKLKAIAAGTYGICPSCDAPITLVALHRIPWRELCGACARLTGTLKTGR
jgi:RNA polymerase-binding transcription factor DksA